MDKGIEYLPNLFTIVTDHQLERFRKTGKLDGSRYPGAMIHMVNSPALNVLVPTLVRGAVPAAPTESISQQITNIGLANIDDFRVKETYAARVTPLTADKILVGNMTTARGRQLATQFFVPLVDYQGEHKEPFLLICRQLEADEIMIDNTVDGVDDIVIRPGSQNRPPVNPVPLDIRCLPSKYPNVPDGHFVIARIGNTWWCCADLSQMLWVCDNNQGRVIRWYSSPGWEEQDEGKIEASDRQ
ncbi:MAG: hypothetical protein WCT32_03125 [Patescibacteria group bacterium]|jgi:hypothetical protein